MQAMYCIAVWSVQFVEACGQSNFNHPNMYGSPTHMLRGEGVEREVEKKGGKGGRKSERGWERGRKEGRVRR